MSEREPMSPDPRDELKALGEKLIAEREKLDKELQEGVRELADRLLLMLNGIAMYFILRRAARKHGAPEWAARGFGRLGMLIASSPSRLPDVAKSRENFERLGKQWRSRRAGLAPDGLAEPDSEPHPGKTPDARSEKETEETPLPVQPLCVCGHRWDRHGHEMRAGGTACRHDDCGCEAFRAQGGAHR